MIRFTAHYAGWRLARAYVPGETLATDAATERYLVETVQRAEYVTAPKAAALTVSASSGSWYTLSDGRRLRGKAAVRALGIEVP